MKLEPQEEKIKEEIEKVFKSKYSKPKNREWYRNLSNKERAEVQPILDSIGDVVRKYCIEFLPKWREAKEFVGRSYEEIKDKINSIKSEELRKHLGDYLEEIMRILMK